MESGKSGRVVRGRVGLSWMVFWFCAGSAGAAAAPTQTPLPRAVLTPSVLTARSTASPAVVPGTSNAGTAATSFDTGFTVLCYHRFLGKSDPDQLAANQAPGKGKPTEKEILYSLYNLPVEEFRWEMKYLKDHGITPISIEQLKAYWFEGKPLPPQAVLLTFDDGFQSIYKEAYPVVKQYHYPAVLFAYADFIKWQKGAIRYEEIGTMLKNNWTVESHSKSHLHMGKDEEHYSTESFEALLNEELGEPLTFIKEHFNYSTNVLAYPYGDYNDDIVAKASAMGYQLAFGVCPGPNDRTVPPLKLHRNLILFPVKHASFVEIFSNRVLHLSGMYPGDGQLINDHDPTVKVTILDNVVPSSVDLGVDSHPASFKYDPSTHVLTHRADKKMTSGGHILTVRGEDAQGQKYTYSWFFRIKHYKKPPADQVGPHDLY